MSSMTEEDFVYLTTEHKPENDTPDTIHVFEPVNLFRIVKPLNEEMVLSNITFQQKWIDKYSRQHKWKDVEVVFKNNS